MLTVTLHTDSVTVTASQTNNIVYARGSCLGAPGVTGTIVTVTMQAGPSLDMGLSGAFGQGLPAQGMVYCSTVLEPFAYTA